jgi:hypothetical protein
VKSNFLILCCSAFAMDGARDGGADEQIEPELFGRYREDEVFDMIHGPDDGVEDFLNEFDGGSENVGPSTKSGEVY